jgi:transcriptional regulator with XRE-family HTH domain
MSDLTKILKKAFKNRDYRHTYVDEFLNVSIATQIKVLREQRKWTQTELADRVNPPMRQTRISIMENVNYSSWSINTLRKLAEAFDLTLRVSFEGFGERLKDIERINREALERPSFEDDPAFIEAKEEESTAASKVFPDKREDFSDKKPILWLVSRPSAEAAQNKSTPKWEEMVPRKGVKGRDFSQEKQQERMLA